MVFPPAMPGSKEIPLQFDMFSRGLVDTRTPRQKHRDHQQEQPQQAALFSQRDIAQFGVTARPLLPIAPTTRLTLEQQDPRTEEERQRDLQRAAEEQTYQLFSPTPAEPSDEHLPDEERIIYEAAQVIRLNFPVV
jgi:hypothetical protein